MADIVFSPEAKRDLTETGDYIAFKLHNKSAARNRVCPKFCVNTAERCKIELK